MSARTRMLLLAAMLAAVPVLAGGCDALAFLLYKTVGPFVPEDKFEAVYPMEGKSLLVLVDVEDPALAATFPRLEPALADAIGDVLAEKDATGPIVPSRGLEAARQTEPGFREWSVAEVGRYFNVDLVLHVRVLEYRLKDAPGSRVFRGYAETALTLVAPQKDAKVWPANATARLVTAESRPEVEPEDAVEMDATMTEGLGEKIARHFYTHKKSDLPLRPEVR